MIPSRIAFCAARNGHLMTREFAAVWEGMRDETPTPDYDKVKAYAQTMMDNIVQEEPKRTRVVVAVPSGRSWEAGTAVFQSAPLSPAVATWSDAMKDGAYTATFIDPNNKWRCVVSGIVGESSMGGIQAFTVTCYDTTKQNPAIPKHSPETGGAK